MNGLRIGMGYDRHRLIKGRKLIIGGIYIPGDKGLEGHSDADLLCHAVMDALLGAANLGEIGLLFPDTDPAFKDSNSLSLLAEVGEMLKADNYEILNIDCVIIAQSPKISPYYNEIKRNVSDALEILPQQVSIKAKTGERLGWIGHGEGMEATCIALIKKNE